MKPPMSSHGWWRFNLRTAFSIIFLTFLPLNLKTQEVFDPCQDHLLIQSEASWNRRSLVETPPLPGKGPAVGASPPSPDLALAGSTKPVPAPETRTPVGGDGTPSPPPSSVRTAETPNPPSDPPQLLSPPPRPPPSTKKTPVSMIVGIVVGVFTVSVALIIFFLIHTRKIPIKPWTNNSGQLQDALITDVPRLQLSELQAACEDFSNIIGSFSDGTIYKGTLSTGAEIAAVSIADGSRANWSNDMEAQLLQKIRKLAKADHKNFLNVIGYCHENEPFHRMLVFEYAPNGSLSEHLHSQHTEHLDWPTRLRIAMGTAYCLDHMHNLNPPILHTSLDSSCIYLTEDNAAKVSDFSVLNFISPSKESSSSKNLLEHSTLEPQTNVLNFGALVFEIITGRLPDPDSLFLEPKKARDLVDPALKTFQEDVAERLLEVVRQCMNPYSAQRPTMRKVVVKLREITGIAADAALPRLSPRWWTEMEIITTDGN
ncbi:Protein kinase superfamily protein [Raphanus sativus]|uniref:Probable inactive receptor-like protein kinase At3g56050 isoform X2 n=1 Tax=Raphanus sativus TaxID=3726 RepID=A0A6J0L8D0_RAPSA|nr:probable inactive receptor-like protein kinase At3g56050 isoform X2 [Raphanus sativus]KAJ4875211.1 Protein kinase superfamily protein [Raphanus sativus]